MSFRCGRGKAGRLAEGLRTWPVEGEPFARLMLLSDGLRAGGSIEAPPDGVAASTGDSVKPSSKLGVDEDAKSLVATLPNRKGGSEVSAVLGRCGMLLVE